MSNNDFFGLGKPKEEKEEKEENKEDENKKKEDDNKKKEEDNKKKEAKKENDEEDDPLKEEGENKRMENIVMDRIEFDMSQSKKQLRMKKEDKEMMELIRRWQVKIYNIYITPLKDKVDPFIQFTIGGDYNIQVFSNKGGDTYKVPKGERGFADKTEVIESVEPLNRAPFDKIIELEMRMSYAMIHAQKLMVEVWDHNNIWMNTILGYTTVPLLEIVNGDINLSFDINKKEGKKRMVPVCTIDFKCIFQEIWDFKLSFVNWKAGPIVEIKKGVKNAKTEKRHSKVIISMNDKRVIQGYDTSTSVVSKVATAPVWSDFEGDILFRGSQIELENAEVTLSLIDETGLFGREIARKTVNMSGIFDFERIKTDFTLLNETTKDKFTTSIEGFVQIDHKIWYKQTGDSVSLLSRRKYLCINVMRVENIRPAETKGIVDSFISVEWCGSIQRTRTVKENNNPVFNETIYFELPFPEEWLKEPGNYIQKLNEEFATKNEVVFNLMIEGDDNTYDNLGIGSFHLSDIKVSGEKTQRKYFAEDLKKDKTYGTRLYVGKCKLISAFSLSNSTNVNFEAWFLDDFPETIDFGEKKKASEKEDKIPMELLPYFKKSKTYFQDRYHINLQFKMSQNNTYNYKERCFNEKYLIVQDQYKNKHFLPYYLSLITPPEQIFSKEDQENNSNFHDCNLRTLDEVAHYVHCFPYSQDSSGDVWVSPDFLLKTRKGDIEDHAILCACLMMGLSQNDEEEITSVKGGNSTDGNTHSPENDIDSTTAGGKTKATLKEEKTEVKENKDEGYHPYENRVFICIGKLKNYKSNHVWVMTVNDEYDGVTFWDPHTGLKFDLKGRIKDPERCRKFLAGFYPDYESVKANKVSKKAEAIMEEEDDDESKDHSINKEAPKNLYDDQKIPGLNDSYENVIAYNKMDDKDLNDNILDDPDLQMHTNLKSAGVKIKAIDKEILPQNFDERVLCKNTEVSKKKYDFLEDQKAQISGTLAQSDNSFSPVEEFFLNGTKVDDTDINMPYETLDIIFNRNNIWINLNNHDPKFIYFNIYEKSKWMPYFDLYEKKDGADVEKIWTGHFDMFYSLTNFGPTFKPKTVHKMRENLIKEIRVGITAARSGMNLPTRFKKKNEQINDNLGRYCTFLEQRALNRISQKEFDQKVEEWEIMIKQKLPKYFKMESICVFFNFYELEIIRRQITDDLEYFYKTKEKNLMFATSAGIYPYLNQIVSVRIIIAKFYKISEEELDISEINDYRETQLNANVLKEEEDSDDDDDETPGDTPGKTPEKTAGETARGTTKGNPNDESHKKEEEDVASHRNDSMTKGETKKGLIKIDKETPTATPDNRI